MDINATVQDDNVEVDSNTSPPAESNDVVDSSPPVDETTSDDAFDPLSAMGFGHLINYQAVSYLVLMITSVSKCSDCVEVMSIVVLS